MGFSVVGAWLLVGGWWVLGGEHGAHLFPDNLDVARVDVADHVGQIQGPAFLPLLVGQAVFDTNFTGEDGGFDHFNRRLVQL